MSHYAVHVPLASDKRFIQKYLDAGLSEKEAQYASMIEGMDKSLGDIMNYLKQKRVDNNTIILFMSDNGGLSKSARGSKLHTQNLPLKVGKGSVYEGGIREPMLVKWPGIVKPGSVSEQYLIIEDFFPTILEMAAVKNYKTVQPIDGISFVPLLKNKKQSNTERSLIWHFPNKWTEEDGFGINYMSAIRKGDWKLVFNIKTGAKELYNLRLDVGEKYNLSVEYPEKVKQLSMFLSQQLRKYQAQMPTYKSTGKLIPMPD